ncbi:MAG: tetratricopeptide repeat protein [Planctomycetes bacterium]|nr:tetratricopeptide repeat protein [Planctomycetota bacterium]
MLPNGNNAKTMPPCETKGGKSDATAFFPTNETKQGRVRGAASPPARPCFCFICLEKYTWLEKADGAAKALLRLPLHQVQSYEVFVRLAVCKAERFREAKQPEKEREMYEEALGYCEKVIELAPRDFLYAIDRGGILFDLRRFREADRACYGVLKTLPELYEPRLILAEVQRAQGDYEAAIKTLSDILDGKNGNVGAELRRAERHLGLQKYDEALAEANEALRLTDKNPYANYIRGCVYMQIRKLDEAIAEFRIAAAGMRKESLDAAKTQFEEVVKLRGRHVAARLRLAEIHTRQGQYDKAQAELEKLLTLDTDKAKVHRALDDLRRKRAGDAPK